MSAWSLRFNTLSLAIALAVLAGPVRGDDVVLKGSVRMSRPTADIRLADVATLEGPAATALADVVILTLEDPAQVREISVSEVRQRLTDLGVHWGQINLSGRRTIVRPAPGHAAAPPRAMTSVSVKPLAETTTPQEPGRQALDAATALIGEETVRGELVRFLVREMKRRPDTLRVGFPRADAEVLSTAASAYRLEIEPRSSLMSDRIELGIRAWQGRRIEHRWSVPMRLELLTDVRIASADLARGRVLTLPDVATQQRWLSPATAARVAPVEDVVGRATTIRLDSGAMILDAQLRAPTVVRRGDHVTVRCVVGGLVLSLKAEAREDGALHETIACRKLGERETFAATISGPGEVVIDLND
ncbi:MAG: flagellar basal body P-ring formation chaperone FlgA [Planctomycetota bacterium]|jgi:flagella basal body P-ring formation protein FlgA